MSALADRLASHQLLHPVARLGGDGSVGYTLAGSASASRTLQQLFVGNSYWVALAMLAIAATHSAWNACLRWARGVGPLLVLLAQSLTATALVMTVMVRGATGASKSAPRWPSSPWAACVSIPSHRDRKHGELWVISLSVPVLVLNTGIFMHIRDYSQIALPTVVAPVALLIPTIVGLMDIQVGNKRAAMGSHGHRGSNLDRAVRAHNRIRSRSE